MRIYKIYHSFDINSDDSRYIISKLSQKELSDLLIGFQFYFETTTRFGIYETISNTTAAWFLCTYYHCKEISKNEIINAVNYDFDLGDIDENDWIDIYYEREKRCGKNYDKYIKKIQPNNKSNDFYKYCKLFDIDASKYDLALEDFNIKDIINGKIEKIINSNLPISKKKAMLKGLINQD